MKLLKDLDAAGKRVLLRLDLNVSLAENGAIGDDFRIRVSLPTIEYLLARQCKIIIIAHLGQPKGKDAKLSLRVVSERLSELLKQPVQFIEDCLGESVRQKTQELKSGEILMLENLRFYPQEIANDLDFAKQLAALADVYVNDAFGAIHRAHASIVGLPTLLPSAGGLLLKKEITALDRAMKNCEHPCSVIIGGAKISTKIQFIQAFLKSADHVILGGALANTVLHAQGYAVGKSFIEPELTPEIKNLAITNNKLHLPVDAIVSVDKRGWTSDVHSAPIGKTTQKELILDIGADTELLFGSIISQSKTVIWNGPLGLFELEIFAHGTLAVAEAIINSSAYSVVGGGETITFLNNINLLHKFSHVSSGGGAMLEYLAGMSLPGIEALK